MDESERRNALTAWVATFGSLSRPCEKFTDLADGVLLFEAAAEIDREWFRLIGTVDPSTNTWVPRYNNLKKLHKLITGYLADVLNMDLSNDVYRRIQLERIARYTDEDELEKLTTLLLLLAVHSSATATLISRIQAMDTRVQATLMQIIEAHLALITPIVPHDDHDELHGRDAASSYAGGSSDVWGGRTGDRSDPLSGLVEDEDGGSSSGYRSRTRSHSPGLSLATGAMSLASNSGSSPPGASPSSSAPGPTAAQISQLLLEKRQAEARHRQVVNDYDTLLAEFHAVSGERNTLRDQLSVAESTASTTPAADAALLRAEVHRLRAALQVSEEQREELETVVGDQGRMLADQGRRIADLAHAADEAAHLRDEVDELRDSAEKLRRAEAALDKFRAKMAEAADAKRSAKVYEDQVAALKAQVQRLETELVHRAAAEPRQAEVVASAHAVEAQYFALQETHTRTLDDLHAAHARVQALETDLAKEQERVAELAEQVRELELASSSVGNGFGAADFAAAGHRDMLPDPVSDEDRRELDALRAERAAMQAQFESHKQLLSKARAIIVQGNADRKALVEKHQLEIAEVRVQAQQAAAAAAAAAEHQSAYPEAITSMQHQIQQYQAEVTALWAENAAIREQWRREQVLMASAWHNLPTTRAIGAGAVGGGSGSGTPGRYGGGSAGAGGGDFAGNTWLAQQRRLLSEHIQRQF
ncbi:hypothetical protein H9P43_001513 [Blastocladiella emersonii ATCC 22665]|nr:hypothetical protein H9P43_001513 [Blastocladiella emersonii ATCC 22665]